MWKLLNPIGKIIKPTFGGHCSKPWWASFKSCRTVNRCADSGANAQNFKTFAETTVPILGLNHSQNESHQSKWGSSVYKFMIKPISLEDSSSKAVPAGIDYYSPYDLSVVPKLDPYVVAWKIGSVT